MRVGRTWLGTGMVALGFALPLSGSLAAQGVKSDAASGDVVFVQGAGPEGPGAGFAERIELLGFGGIHGGKVVTGAPFSAMAITETTQTLADGNKITHKTQTNLYRDSQGRFRKEVTLPAIGPLAAQGQPQSFVVIQDPVAGESYVLEADRKIARLLSGPGGRRRGPRDFVQFQKRTDNNNVQKDDLGTQTINGVSAQGTRYTRTIPAGQIGNEKAITIVSESWYSPDLQMLVMSKRNDPRFGETTYQLTSIQRTEPAASLFTVPADYTIKTGGRRGFRREGGMPAPPPDAPPPGM
jgi:hypothetical protein